MCVLELCKCNICPQENATCIVESMCFVQYTYLATNVASLSFLLLASFVVNAHGFSVLVLVCRPPPHTRTHTHARTHAHSHTHTYTHTHTLQRRKRSGYVKLFNQRVTTLQLDTNILNPRKVGACLCTSVCQHSITLLESFAVCCVLYLTRMLVCAVASHCLMKWHVKNLAVCQCAINRL